MCKLLSTLLLVSAIPYCSVAQTSTVHIMPGKHRPHKNHTPAAHHDNAYNNPRDAAKTTATSSRLIAHVSFDCVGATFIPVDSAAASYSGARGGTYNNSWEDWEWAFDDALVYPYLPSTSAYGSARYRSSQTFDASDHIITSTSEVWIPHTSSWRNSYKDTYTYDGAGNRLTELNQNWDTVAGTWKNLNNEIYTYTAANKVATDIYETWNTGTSSWNQGSKRSYTYDASNNMVSDLGEYWNSTASVWENFYRTTNTYDAANNLTVSLYEMWNTTTLAWEISGRRTYTYDASNRRTEELYENYNSTSGLWEPGQKELYSNFDGSQPQTIIFQNWDGGLMAFENTERENYTYNSDDKVTYFYNEDWNYMTGVWELNSSCYAERRIYETYTTSDITDNATPGKKLTIYPIPARQTLTIEHSWANAEPFTVTISDMNGKIYTRWNQPGQTNYKETISTGNMQPGNYMVTLQSKTGKTVRPLTIVK